MILPWLLSSCAEKPEEPCDPPEISQLPYGGRFLLSDRGDTIPTGVPIQMAGRRMDPDSLAKPKTFPLLRKPEVLPASSHPAIVDPPKKAPLPANLKVVMPGKDGVPLPKQIPVKSKVLPIRQPQLVPALPLEAVNDRSNWRRLDVEQGLNSSFIVDIFIDSRGYLWIGTSGGGVSRYDGGTFSHFTKEQGMTGNQTKVLLEDSRGHLWFTSHDHAVDTSILIRYDGNDFRQFYGGEGLTSDWDYTTMFEDREGHLWIGTRRGVARLELAEGGISGILTPYTEKEGLPGKTVWSMTEDDEGYLWIGTFEGLGRFDPAVNEGWGSFTQFGAEEGLNSNFIQSVRNIGSNRIWLETNAGACLFDGSSFTQYNMQERYGYSFIPSRRSDSPRFASGDQLFNDFGNPFLNFPAGKGFSNVAAKPAREDSFGNWWRGAEGFGVSKLNRKHHFVYIPEIEGLKTNRFTSVYPDSKGNIWIGTGGLGVVCYNPQGKGVLTLYTEKEGLIDNDVQTIFEDKRGSIWIGTKTGVSRYDPAPEGGGGTLTNYGEKEGLRGIVTIVEDGGGNLWFGGYGVYRYDPQQKEFTELLGKEDYFVRDIIEDGQGQFWFASNYGLYRYDPVNSTFTIYTEREGLPSNRTNVLIEDRRGRIWVGTSEGVCYFNGGSFTTLPLKKGWWQYSFQAFGKFNSIHSGRQPGPAVDQQRAGH